MKNLVRGIGFLLLVLGVFQTVPTAFAADSIWVSEGVDPHSTTAVKIPPNPAASSPGANLVWRDDAVHETTGAHRLCRSFGAPTVGILDTGLLACQEASGNIQVCQQNAGAGLGGNFQANCEVRTPAGALVSTQNINGAIDTSTDAATGQTTVTGGVITGIEHVLPAIADWFLKGTLVPLSYAVFTLCSWILAIVGVLFNWTIIRTVFEFARFFGNSANLLIAWGILRDVGNILLLFGFIFMGVSTILDLPHSKFTAKQALPALLIFALLLNFSLFAAEAVIDVANGFSSVLAQQAGQACDPTAGPEACANLGISGKIFEMTGGSGFFADPLPCGGLKGSGQCDQFSAIQQISVYLILALFVLVTAVVLLAGSIMLIIRAVVLVFVIVTSPIGFAGMAVPRLHGLASQWWDALIKQAFFAPIYLLLIFISIKIADGLGKTGNLAAAIAGGGANTDSIGGSAGGLQAVLIFALVIGFMLASLLSAKQLGAMGAGFATNSASSLVFGGFTRGANLTVGTGARLARMGQQTRIGRALTGPAGEFAVNRFLRPLESVNLDPRRVPGVGMGLNAAGITTGAQVAKGATFKDFAHMYHEAASGTQSKALNRQYQSEVNKKDLEQEAHDADAAGTHELTANNGANQSYLTRMDTDELASLHGIETASETLARNLSPQQFSNLMKSTKLSDTQKDNLRDARFAGERRAVESAKKDTAKAKADELDPTKTQAEKAASRAAANQSVEAARKKIQKLTDEDMNQLSHSRAHSGLLDHPELAGTFADLVTDDQAEKIRLNNNIGVGQRSAFQDERNNVRYGAIKTYADAKAVVNSTDPSVTAAERSTAQAVVTQLTAEAETKARALGDKDWEQLALSDQKEVLNNQEFAGMLTDEQSEKFRTNQKIPQSQRDTFQEARNENRYGEIHRFVEAEKTAADVSLTPAQRRTAATYVANNKAPVKTKVRYMSDKDWEQASYSPKFQTLLNSQGVAAMVKHDQADKIKNNPRIEQTKRTAFDTQRDARFEAGNVVSTLAAMSPDDVKNIPDEKLRDVNVLGAMSANQLMTIDPSKLDEATTQAIVNFIRSGPPTMMRFNTLVGATGLTALNPDAGKRWAGYI